MKLIARHSFGAAWIALGLCSTMTGVSVDAIEPQTLFNFQLGPGTVTGTLVQGPDGNFYGTTADGGPTANGTVFRVTPGGALTTLLSDQPNPAPGLVIGNDGLLYGMTSAGGPSGFGTAFKMTTSGVPTNFAVLNGVNGRSPLAGLVLAGDGNFYGTSQQGGTNGVGALFRVSPGGVVTLLVSFEASSIGAFPVAGLTLGPEGNLYGVTSFGGTGLRGTIFKVTLAGSLTTIHSFQAAESTGRQARLTLGRDGNLYGTSQDGGNSNLGAVFKITTNGVYTTLVSFNRTNGAVPFAELTPGADGQLYGTTQQGGSANVGTIFKVTTNGALTTLASFTSAANGMPQAGLLLARDGNFYGCSAGAVFRMTPGGALAPLVSLYPLSGAHPQGGLALGPDGNLYGTTRDGGTDNAGTIFRLTADGTLTSLFSFSTTNGLAPQAGLALGKDGNFYGTTSLGGGPASSGTVFRFVTNGTLTTLGSFTATNGANPQCQLVMDASGNFYGTAPEQGLNFVGTVFRVATNGVLSTLVPFSGANGASPQCDGLALGNDGNLYGTTADGGIGFGNVFRVTPGGALTSLFSFTGGNGSAPQGGLLLGQDGNFYGTATFGGTNAGIGFGTIFRITMNGVLTTLFNFHFTDGEEPVTRLIQANDGNLYGTTPFGGLTNGIPGSTGFGTVFRITTNGVFTSLVLFHGTNGSVPLGSLLMGPDGNLYGTTSHGGTGGGGTLFRIVLTPHLAGVTKLANGSRGISGTGPAASPFRLWASTNISNPFATWTLLTNSLFANDGTFSFADTAAANLPARFYRVGTP